MSYYSKASQGAPQGGAGGYDDEGYDMVSVVLRVGVSFVKGGRGGPRGLTGLTEVWGGERRLWSCALETKP